MSVHHTLKIWATVRNGYLYFFREMAVVGRIIAPSVMFASLMISLGAWLIFGEMDYTPPKIFPEMIACIIALFATGHIAVGVHRAILLKETKPRIFRFGSPEAHYIAILSGLAAIFYVPRALEIQSTVISLLLTLAAVMVSVWVLAFLPAVAISDTGVTLGTVWRNLHKNRLRFVGAILTIGAILLVHLIVGAQAAVILVKFWISITPVFNFPRDNRNDFLHGSSSIGRCF